MVYSCLLLQYQFPISNDHQRSAKSSLTLEEANRFCTSVLLLVICLLLSFDSVLSKAHKHMQYDSTPFPRKASPQSLCESEQVRITVLHNPHGKFQSMIELQCKAEDKHIHSFSFESKADVLVVFIRWFHYMWNNVT